MNRSFATKVAALLAAGCVFTMAPDESSAATYWSMNGAGCMPVDTDIQNNTYLVTNGSVKHQSGGTALVKLMCPVSQGSSFVNYLLMSYKDEQAADTDAYVQAVLYAKNRSTGTLTSVTTLTSDNDPSHPTGNTEWSSSNFAHTMDFNTYFYYVYASFDRNSALDGEVTFSGASLES